MSRKQIIILVLCALMGGMFIRILGIRNGGMLCIVIAIATWGIRKEVKKMKGEDKDEDKKEK